MKNFISRSGIAVAVAAAAMSVVWGFVVPYGYPWLSFAWALVACGAAVWVAKRSFAFGSSRSMSDVIGDVEEEPGQAPAASNGVVPR